MASRNERKRLAKARKSELVLAVSSAFKADEARQAEKQARHEALISVNQWHRKGTRCICHPGFAQGFSI